MDPGRSWSCSPVGRDRKRPTDLEIVHLYASRIASGRSQLKTRIEVEGFNCVCCLWLHLRDLFKATSSYLYC